MVHQHRAHIAVVEELRRTQAHLSQYTELDARPPTNFEWVDQAHEELQAMLEADDHRHEDSDESKKVRAYL